ncbi:Protein of unknown function [Collimonas sp. OK307]|uniref:DUF2924 domain-containing protein n=1 Tax=Collimonas sp. OK307 TaxID=1801620 RepID=UPI0008E7F254|nr:DUF2924 domain-containing protein [Collimonas sp. OK307]SFI32769.1 Protein of unknown function [Collimonas sp. OK307]
MPKLATSRQASGSGTLKIDPHHVDALNDLDNVALRSLWIEHFGRAPPFRARKSLLIDCLAYRIQEQAFGGLAMSTRTRLRKLASDVNEGKKPILLFQPSIKPGTRLIRAWGGQTHEVQVIDDGFTYRDQRYTNLSEIARVITGSRWSGPRFFGILRSNPAKEVSHGQ